MIVANLYPIKSTNGLYYYGLDYLKEHAQFLRRVLVRPAMAAEVSKSLPDLEVVTCDLPRLLREARLASRSGDLLFTPTSHPLPGISRQWIVVHDAYPFVLGWRGLVKRALLTLCLATSRCQVAYINRADALPFIKALGVSEPRRIFAPNRFPGAPRIERRERTPGMPLSVGLVGTDSPKKNYEQLFSALAEIDSGSSLAFRIYGHDSAYFREVRHRFPQVSIELIPSDRFSLDQFFQDVDVVASVATQEGFGRPIAAALLAGIPCVLVECGVFREFFDGAALFQASAAAVAATLVQATRSPLDRPQYTPPAEILSAYQSANARLATLGNASTDSRP